MSVVPEPRPKDLFPLLVALFLSCVPALASAEPPVPKLCIGYNPVRQSWDPLMTMALGHVEDSCPDGYAIMGTDFAIGARRPGKNISIVGHCCPLPDGVLTARHVFAAEECPDDTVATGVRAERQVEPCPDDWGKCVREWDSMIHELRCTAIDTTRFRLGDFTPAYVVGFNQRPEIDAVSEEHYTTRTRIPLGIRYGVVRAGRFNLDSGGFVGFPWGSIFAAKRSKFSFYFRQLQYRGVPGDPPAGSPVQVIPECLILGDPLDPQARCENEAPVSLPPLNPPVREADLPRPDALTPALWRNEFRAVQFYLATTLSLKRLFLDPEAETDPAYVRNKARWKAGTPGEVKESMTANVVRRMEDEGYSVIAVRDRFRALPALYIPVSPEIDLARLNILRLMQQLPNDASWRDTVSAIDSWADELRDCARELAKRSELRGARIDEPLLFSIAERDELQEFGMVPRGIDPERVDDRSKLIVEVIRSDPHSAR